jgi:hypothetical protein
MFNKIKNFFTKSSTNKALEAPYKIETPPEMIIAPSGSWMYASPVILVDSVPLEQERTSKVAKTEPPKFTKSE